MDSIRDFLRMLQLHSHRKEFDRVGMLLDDPDVTRLVQIAEARRNGVEAAAVLLDYYDGEIRPAALDVESIPLTETELATAPKAGGFSGTRLVNLLESNHITTVGDLLATSMETIGGFRQMGPIQLRQIEAVRNRYQRDKAEQVGLAINRQNLTRRKREVRALRQD